jgi:serine/threonine-protein kinase
VATSHVVHGLRREVRSKQRLGQYLLEKKIGEGGMGVVYQASHALLRRPTAVKLLPPERAGVETIARFEREVRRTAELTHPNTVTVFDYGRTPDGLFYYAMELLDGVTLEEAVEQSGPQPEGRVVHVLACVAGALAEAHAAGLIHRDIKPQNIMLCERRHAPDVVKVLDFGLVKELDRAGGAPLSDADRIAGTPLYLAPEAISAPDRVDARSDIYALGAVGYFLLTGQHVFLGATLVEICAHHFHSAPVPPHQRLGLPVSPSLETLLLACLSKDPAARPASAPQLLEQLRHCNIDTWTEARASAWWTQHGNAVRERRRPAPVLGSNTLAVRIEG